MSRVGIVGLGLMGGSLARDLSTLGWAVAGTDRDPVTVEAARDAGVLDHAIDSDGGDLTGLDLLVLAVPVRSASEWLHRLASRLDPATVVTDVGSTKRSVVAAARAAGLGPRFVGSHPMTGDDRSGWSAARSGLYRDAAVWLCPAPESTPDAVERVEALWRSVGATPTITPAAEHDRRVARSSHLPQLAATALGRVLDRAGLTVSDLGPGGRDTTRLAGSDPAMWTDILLDNADEVGPAVDALVETLLAIRDAVARRDDGAIRSAVAAGRAWRHRE